MQLQLQQSNECERNNTKQLFKLKPKDICIFFTLACERSYYVMFILIVLIQSINTRYTSITRGVCAFNEKSCSKWSV